jgi:hypothetical protein
MGIMIVFNKFKPQIYYEYQFNLYSHEAIDVLK